MAHVPRSKPEIFPGHTVSIENLQDPKEVLTSSSPKIENYLSRIDDIQKEKYFGFVITAAIIIPFIALLYFFDGHQNIYHFIAFFLANILSIFVIYFFYIVLNIPNLHYILILRKPLDNFKTNNLFIPYKIFEDTRKPITSISHLFALRGSNFEKFCTILLTLTFGMIFAAVMTKWSEGVHDTRHKSEILILLSSGMCLPFLVFWDIGSETKHSRTTDIMHYIIASLVVFLAPIAFAMNQKGSALSITMFSVIFCLFIVWFLLLDKILFAHTNEHKTFESVSRVHRVSLIYIITELIVVLLMLITIVLFIYCMQNDEIL